MLPLLCCYFQVHQPYRLRDLRFTELGDAAVEYFDAERNHQIFRKVAEKCYLPANALLLRVLNEYPEFSVAFSLSGVFLEQCEEYGTDVLESFRQLVATGRVELLAETYYHSLSAVFSQREFCEQIEQHVSKIQTVFGVRPVLFRNTELITSNQIAAIVRQLGFRGMLTEGVDRLLNGRSPNFPYRPNSITLAEAHQEILRQPVDAGTDRFSLLLKNYRLSDDIAFRFSDRTWVGFPLTAEKFTDWLQGERGHSINLFMDFETFGEHQWADTGIFRFLESLPAVWQARGYSTATPTQVLERWNAGASETYDLPEAISWADTERDLSAWRGNQIQEAALRGIYALEDAVRQSGDERLITDWRKLQTSDHFYYMCTKYWNDGDVHRYFSPYDSPYEAYRRFSHALWDVRLRLERRSKPSVVVPLHTGRDLAPYFAQ